MLTSDHLQKQRPRKTNNIGHKTKNYPISEDMVTEITNESRH